MICPPSQVQDLLYKMRRRLLWHRRRSLDGGSSTRPPLQGTYIWLAQAVGAAERQLDSGRERRWQQQWQQPGRQGVTFSTPSQAVAEYKTARPNCPASDS